MIAPVLLCFVNIIITIMQRFRSAKRVYRAFNRACLCLAYINILPFYTIALLIKALLSCYTMQLKAIIVSSTSASYLLLILFLCRMFVFRCKKNNKRDGLIFLLPMLPETYNDDAFSLRVFIVFYRAVYLLFI